MPAGAVDGADAGAEMKIGKSGLLESGRAGILRKRYIALHMGLCQIYHSRIINIFYDSIKRPHAD
ncbi:hypothetical protein [Lacisediminimonas sp.]|uniref:hypothetical protein n=1 Tax=Lacisediminimonas sp. TaxID=3060582 RepID=UPI002727BF38|nr:hypothetical protein [Lacisediminimonas sp.]MDO9218939.1 hypothetical protein [Lacisediminimonas sp.]